MKKIQSKHKRRFAIITLITGLIIITMMPSQKCYSQNSLTKSNRTAADATAQQPKGCGSYTIDTAALTIAKAYEMSNSNNFLSTAYTIRVYFHICTDNNGSNAAATEAQIKSELNTLISDYSSNNICFINMGTNYVNSTAINQMTTLNSSLLTPYLVPNCINYFYQQQLGGWGGNAYSIPNTYCSIVSGNIGAGHTISHETGHCFGLLHTFETAFGYEKINGSNSSSTGDQITDTPADPYAYNGQTCFSASACCYTGSCTDANGQSNFTVPYTNLMAYWWIYGYSNLAATSGQYTRVNSYLSSNASLQACESSSSVTFGPVSYSSGYHMSSAVNTLTSNGTVLLNGTTVTTLGGALVDLQPGFRADATGGALILIRPSLCSPVSPRNGSGTTTEKVSDVKTNDLKCYPNPFTGKITVEFNLNKDDNASIKLFDLTGREIKIISNTFYEEGKYEITTDVSDIKAGIYFVVLQGSYFRKEQKVVKLN